MLSSERLFPKVVYKSYKTVVQVKFGPFCDACMLTFLKPVANLPRLYPPIPYPPSMQDMTYVIRDVEFGAFVCNTASQDQGAPNGAYKTMAFVAQHASFVWMNDD